jgi:hypothetical protein
MLKCIAKLPHLRAITGKVRCYPLNKFCSKRESVVTQMCSSTTGDSFARGIIHNKMSHRKNEIVPSQSKIIQSSVTLFAASRRFLSSSHVGHSQSLQSPDSSTAPEVAELLQNISLENVILSASLDPVPTGWSPAALAEFGIVAIHDAFGLPWCLSIAGITVVLRGVLFPLVVYQVGVLLVCNTVIHFILYMPLIVSVASWYHL